MEECRAMFLPSYNVDLSLLEVFQGIMTMIAAMSFKWIHYMKLVYSIVMSAIKFFLFKITPSPFPGFRVWSLKQENYAKVIILIVFLALLVPPEKNMEKIY